MMKYLADKGYEVDFSGSHWKMKLPQYRHFTRLDTLDERLTPDFIQSCLGGLPIWELQSKDFLLSPYARAV